MMTNSEIDNIVYACRQAGDDSTYATSRAILAAYQSKLLAGVEMPEPIDCVRIHDGYEYLMTKACEDYFTKDQLLKVHAKLAYANEVIDQRNAMISRGHADFVQAITDPENQPSQWGTVTLAMYEKLQFALERIAANRGNGDYAANIAREALGERHAD